MHKNIKCNAHIYEDRHSLVAKQFETLFGILMTSYYEGLTFCIQFQVFRLFFFMCTTYKISKYAYCISC